jgi:hypothetical protein
MFHREQSPLRQELQPAEVVNQYHEALGQIVSHHDRGMDDAVHSYSRDVKRLIVEQPSAAQVQEVLAKPGDTIAGLTDDTLEEVERVINSAADDCFLSLSSADQSHLKLAQVKTKQVDVGSNFWEVSPVLNKASYDTRSVMKAALDKEIWRQAKAKAQEVDLEEDAWKVSQIIQHASTYQVRGAMEAALDSIVWRQAKRMTKKVDLSTDFWKVSRILGSASNYQARSAMEAALDKEIWYQARAKTREKGIREWQISALLSKASNYQFRDAMETTLREDLPRELGFDRLKKLRGILSVIMGGQTKEQGRVKPKPSSRERQEETPPQYEYAYDVPDMEDFFRNFFRDTFGQDTPPGYDERQGTGARDRTTPPPPPRQERTSKYQEVDAIVAEAERAFYKDNPTATKWNEKWLTRTDKAAIQRVVNSVRQIREQAVEKGETVTDRQIYIMYRRKIETDQLDEATKQRLTGSTQIILALMGGKPSGKLPF